jgi:hypothetical protein
MEMSNIHPFAATSADARQPANAFGLTSVRRAKIRVCPKWLQMGGPLCGKCAPSTIHHPPSTSRSHSHSHSHPLTWAVRDAGTSFHRPPSTSRSHSHSHSHSPPINLGGSRCAHIHPPSTIHYPPKYLPAMYNNSIQINPSAPRLRCASLGNHPSTALRVAPLRSGTLGLGLKYFRRTVFHEIRNHGFCAGTSLPRLPDLRIDIQVG